jgi:hypothetical protein
MHKFTRSPAFIGVLGALVLSACSGSEQAPPPPSNDAAMSEDAPVTNAPVTLPPSLLASKTFRCKDNSLVYVDFFSDNTTADLRTEKTAPATKLTAAEAGKPYEGGGFTVSGNGDQVEITQPGKGSQTCKA